MIELIHLLLFCCLAYLIVAPDRSVSRFGSSICNSSCAFKRSPLGLTVTKNEFYDDAHLENITNEPQLWLYRLQFEVYGVSNIRIVDRISKYKEKLEGIT